MTKLSNKAVRERMVREFERSVKNIREMYVNAKQALKTPLATDQIEAYTSEYLLQEYPQTYEGQHEIVQVLGRCLGMTPELVDGYLTFYLYLAYGKTPGAQGMKLLGLVNKTLGKEIDKL